ncbi:hypothetical protein ABZ569_16275 [Streptomyces albus]|uniref:hypothetical protein n=1 Tax=Streptomyces albus TaxID=1888 RepID=UPI0033F5E7E6
MTTTTRGTGNPPGEEKPPRGLVLATLGALRRNRRPLAVATGRIVGLTAATGLLVTAAVFGCAWPVFTAMRNARIQARLDEDPYSHDPDDLLLVTACALPVMLILLGAGCAALQSACSRAVAAGAQQPCTEADLREAVRARLLPVLTVYALRGLAVWAPPVTALWAAVTLTGPPSTPPYPLRRGTLPAQFVETSPVLGLLIAVVLRVFFALAPAAAANGLPPLAALRRSRALVWSRAGWLRTAAVAAAYGLLVAGAVRLLAQLALPLRPLVRSAVQDVTGNCFAAYYAGLLAPVVVGLVLSAALCVPVAYTTLATLHSRLAPNTPHPAPTSGTGRANV